jgi:hypothetical protein
MSQRVLDLNAVSPEAREYLETILGGLAQANSLTAHMSKKDAVESLLELLKAGLITLHYDDEAEEFSIVLPYDFEVVTVQ